MKRVGASIKTAEEIAAMRVSGSMLARVLDLLTKHSQVDVSTRELAQLAAKELKAMGGQPAFLNYQGFPDVLCVSVNEQLVHGLPGDYRLRAGDIVGLDFGVSYKGMITDGAVTVAVGEASAQAKRLLTATAEALQKGIAAVKDGARVGDISAAVEGRLAADWLGVVEDLVGHGVGHSLHEEPNVPNYGPAGRGPVLSSGMAIAIEPMATLGGKEVLLDRDGWTVVTADGSLAAQFEHTVLVTATGAEILTALE